MTLRARIFASDTRSSYNYVAQPTFPMDVEHPYKAELFEAAATALEAKTADVELLAMQRSIFALYRYYMPTLDGQSGEASGLRVALEPYGVLLDFSAYGSFLLVDVAPDESIDTPELMTGEDSWRTELKATLFNEPETHGFEIDLRDKEEFSNNYFALNLDGAHREGAMQGAGICMDTHAASIELVDSEDGKFALYRHLYPTHEGMKQYPLEQYMQATYGQIIELVGTFLLVEKADYCHR